MHQIKRSTPETGLHLFALAGFVYTLSRGNTGFHVSDTLDPGLAAGKWAVRFLLVSLSMTPLRTYFRWNRAVRLRKPAGLWSFVFAGIHVWFYFQNVSVTWAAITRPLFILLGLVGLLILIMLTATSNRWAMRKLRKNWKRLHRLVYLAGGAVVIHAFLAVSMSKKMYMRDPQAVHELRIYLDILVVLLLVRLPQIKGFLTRSTWLQPVQKSTQTIREKKLIYPSQNIFPVRGNGRARKRGPDNPHLEKEGVAEREPEEKVLI